MGCCEFRREDCRHCVAEGPSVNAEECLCLYRDHGAIEVKATLCTAISARVRRDKRYGKTTSEAQKDFIRRTCSCDECVAWRRVSLTSKLCGN